MVTVTHVRQNENEQMTDTHPSTIPHPHRVR